jgi:hypothetical protein
MLSRAPLPTVIISAAYAADPPNYRKANIRNSTEVVAGSFSAPYLGNKKVTVNSTSHCSWLGSGRIAL